jgi:hypothetical protein
MQVDLITIVSKLEDLIKDITMYEKNLWDNKNVKEAKICDLNLDRLKSTKNSMTGLFHESDKIESRRKNENKK